MSQEEEKLVIIVDIREENMVSHLGGKPTVRLARFLKPSGTSMDQIPQPPLIKTMASKFKKCPFQVHFIGWKSLQPKNWKQYNEAIWKESGIYDSIMASTYEFRKDEDLIIGLAECWCSATNTFMFKWGEASMTLEDMLIIGGFSILGKPITTSLTTELLEIEEKLIQVLRDLCRTKARKASHTGWLKLFMGNKGDLGHAAFQTPYGCQ
ncbi:Aminotransferase-like mobile domain containing protein, partial [Thalictrum thalictroides]